MGTPSPQTLKDDEIAAAELRLTRSPFFNIIDRIRIDEAVRLGLNTREAMWQVILALWNLEKELPENSVHTDLGSSTTVISEPIAKRMGTKHWSIMTVKESNGKVDWGKLAERKARMVRELSQQAGY